MKAVTTIVGLGALAALLTAGPAQASPANALQPANVYFGQVVSGQHPTKTITVRNPTGRNQVIRRFDLSGAGGRKFTLTWTHATCRAGMKLSPASTCTLVVRVATTKPEFWQTVVSVYYGRSPAFKHGTRGQFNGAVYAHVVAA